MFKFAHRHLLMETAVVSHRNIAAFFRHHDSESVGSLRHTECAAVAQSEVARERSIVRHRENTSGSANAVVGNNHGAIMERRVFEKNILNEP